MDNTKLKNKFGSIGLPTNRKGKLGKKLNFVSAIMLIFLIVYSIILFSMLIWAFYNSFKTRSDYMADRLALPETLYLENYLKLIVDGVRLPEFSYPFYVETLFLYSFIYAGLSALIGCMSRCFVAYISSKFKYKLSSFIYAFVVVAMALPIIGGTTSEISILRNLGLYDTFVGMFLLKAHFLGMYFLVFYAAFESIPNTYSEAAKIDGASNFTIMFRIYIPLVMNIVLVSFLIDFIGMWNDYSVPLLYLPSYPTLSRAVFSLVVESQEYNWVPIRFAGGMIVVIPVLILFCIFSKKLMSGVSAGGIKG